MRNGEIQTNDQKSQSPKISSPERTVCVGGWGRPRDGAGLYSTTAAKLVTRLHIPYGASVELSLVSVATDNLEVGAVLAGCSDQYRVKDGWVQPLGQTSELRGN